MFIAAARLNSTSALLSELGSFIITGIVQPTVLQSIWPTYTTLDVQNAIDSGRPLTVLAATRMVRTWRPLNGRGVEVVKPEQIKYHTTQQLRACLATHGPEQVSLLVSGLFGGVSLTRKSSATLFDGGGAVH